MAHRLTYKINRFILQNNLKISNGRFQSTKIKVVDKFPQNKPLTRSITDSPTQQNVEGNIQKVSYSSQNGLRSKREQSTPGELKSFPRTSSTTEYCAPQVVATVAAGPQIELPPRRRFEKSNTHNALTQPLKLPRLANPFPEPVKTLMSHTVSDKEKQDLMFAEIKMERQFLEQQKREASIKQQETKYQQELDEYRERSSCGRSDAAKCSKFKQSENAPPNLATVAENVDLYNSKRTFKPDAGPKASVADGFGTGKRYYSNYAKSRYCMQTEAMPTPVQEAEMILNSLKSFYPEHELPKKSLFTPGSPEEKKFVEKTLQFLAKHKRTMHKSSAPFPSYSEVKTFVRRPSFRVESQEADRARPKTTTQIDATASIDANGFGKRSYSTKIAMVTTRRYGRSMKCPATGKSAKCPIFTMKNCKKPNPEKCMRLVRAQKCKKLEAPYPAYTDCVESPYEAWPSECKLCPWLMKGIDYSKISKKYSTYAGLRTARHFNTSARLLKKKVMRIRPKPCKNPAKHKPCDYVSTATKRDKIRSKYRGHPTRPDYKKMDRDYSTMAGPLLATGEPATQVQIDYRAGYGKSCGSKVKVCKTGKSTKRKKKRKSKRKSKKSKSKRSKSKKKKAPKKKKCRAPKKRPIPKCKSDKTC